MFAFYNFHIILKENIFIMGKMFSCCFVNNEVKPLVVTSNMQIKVILSTKEHIEFLKDVGELKNGHFEVSDLKQK